MFNKFLNLLVVVCMLFAFVPFGNFAEAKNKDNLKEEKETTTKERLELVEERTALSKTYDNLDGTLSTEITQIPQHYQDNKGQWREINNNLTSTKEGKIKNKENSFIVEFDEKINSHSKGMEIHEDRYKVNLQLAKVANETIETLQPSIGDITDNQITYEEIFEDISAIYTIGENYVKEDIILESYPQNGLPEKFSYTLDLQGLTYKAIDNRIYLLDKETNESVYLIEAPFMYDAYQPKEFKAVAEIDSVPEEAKSYNLTLNVKEKDNQLIVDLIPDLEWLSAPERQYPVVIDPMITRLQGKNDMVDTTIRSSFPTTTGGNDKELGVGTAGDGNTVRSLLRFDLTSIPSAAEILSANLNLYLTSTNNSAAAINIRLHEMTNSWEENEASWKYKKNSPYTQWNVAGGDFSSENIDIIREIKEVPANIEDSLKQWTIPNDVVKQWVTNTQKNYGVILKSSTESTKIYKKFASSEGVYDLQYQPKIVVTYKTPSRLGLEDYWDYTSHPLSNGTQFVNLGTLNNILQYQDFSLLNHAGFGLDFTRTYNSKDYEKSAFGYGWTFTGNQKLFIGTGDSKQDIQYKDEDGTIHTFTYKASTKSYESPRGLYDVLNVTDNIYTITTPTGLVTKFEVKESAADTNVKVAYITEQKDLNNNAITYSYNLKNQLESIYTSADSTHQKLVFSYNPSNLISKITHNNQVYTYTYSNDYLIKVTQKRSVTNTTDTTSTEFFYTENNQLAQVKDANGNVTSFMYNSALDLTEVSRNGVMDSTIYKLDRPTSKMTVTSPEGLKTEYTLNGNFIVTEILQPSGERTAYEIDDNYNVLKETIFYTDGTNAIQSYTYNTKGSMLTNIDPNQLVTTYTYNAKQSVLSETAPDKTVIAYTYDNKENLVSIKAPNGDITTYMNNSMGDLVKVTYPNGSTETYTTSYVNGEESTVYKDDVLGTTSTIVTDMYGNTISSTDEKGQQTNYNYNLKNELTAVIDSEENKTSYTYDGNGNLLTNTNALNQTMELTYTPQNQVAKETNARGQETSYSYNKDGDLTGIIKANNDKIAYTFKADGTSNITANGVLQYTTHPDGLTTTAINHNANQTVHYTANEDGMLQTVRFNDQSPNDVHYSYEIDKLANVQFSKYKLAYQYDSNSQLSAIVSSTLPLATFAYDKNGLKTKTSFGNSRSAIENGYKGTSTQLQNEKLYTNTLTTPWKTNAYSYDANGNITAVTSGSGTTYYTYDKLNQLTQERLPDGQIIQYQYDKVGNRTQKTVTKNGVITTKYTFNEANQMTKAGTQDYTVDRNGNLTNDGRYQYEWNAFDQLTGVKTIDGVKVAEYKYDENGRRIYSKVESTETYYRYDGTSNYVLFEENSSGVITKTYTYDINGHPLTITYGDSIYYYLTNYRGDVLALTDASGTVVAEYTYDAWGNILSQAGTMASVNPYRYAGYRFDEETKLYYLMARYYNPDTGVFLSLDPVRGDTMNPITMNGYNYANNNPVMMVDPNGESTFSVTFNRIKNALLYGLGKWMSFYIPASLYNSLKNGSIAPYLLFGEKILNGVKASIKAYINGKKTFSYLVADIKNTMANSRQEQQLLLKNAQKQIRKYSAKAASKILLKTVFSWGDLGIIGWYTGSGYINRYGWKQAWK